MLGALSRWLHVPGRHGAAVALRHWWLLRRRQRRGRHRGRRRGCAGARGAKGERREAARADAEERKLVGVVLQGVGLGAAVLGQTVSAVRAGRSAESQAKSQKKAANRYAKALRSQLLMACHDAELTDLCASDRCHRLAWLALAAAGTPAGACAAALVGLAAALAGTTGSPAAAAWARRVRRLRELPLRGCG